MEYLGKDKIKDKEVVDLIENIEKHDIQVSIMKLDPQEYSSCSFIAFKWKDKSANNPNNDCYTGIVCSGLNNISTREVLRKFTDLVDNNNNSALKLNCMNLGFLKHVCDDLNNFVFNNTKLEEIKRGTIVTEENVADVFTKLQKEYGDFVCLQNFITYDDVLDNKIQFETCSNGYLERELLKHSVPLKLKELDPIIDKGNTLVYFNLPKANFSKRDVYEKASNILFSLYKFDYSDGKLTYGDVIAQLEKSADLASKLFNDTFIKKTAEDILWDFEPFYARADKLAELKKDDGKRR